MSHILRHIRTKSDNFLFNHSEINLGFGNIHQQFQGYIFYKGLENTFDKLKDTWNY